IRDGKVFAGSADIGLPAPERISKSENVWRLVASNGRAAVMYQIQYLTPGSVTTGASVLYIRNAQRGEWQTVQVPGSEPRVKMIDSWIIGAAVTTVRPSP